MAQTINTNVLSLTAQRNLNTSQNALQTSIERLSSGLRINSAKDDAAGLAISERFTAQIRGLNQAARNANDGISFAQTAEGALSTVGDSLQRVRELAVQAANDTNSAADRQSLNNEVGQLLSEINRVSQATEFNGQKILNGSTGSLTFQVGANQGQTINVTGVDARGSQLGAAVQTGTSVTASTLATNDGDTLTINGYDVTVSSDIDTTVDNINAVASDSGVQAGRASSTSQTLAYTADTSDARTLTINNVDIAIAAGATEDDLLTAVNNVSDQTGVTVTGDGAGNITFANTDGADISVAQDADPDAGATGATDIFADLDSSSTGGAESETFQAGLELSADVGDQPTLTYSGTGTLADLGLTNGGFTDNVLSNVDVLTQSTASDALSTVDYALAQVNSQRAELGAVQSRFENTITNLSSNVENLSAARSRIQDADFAKETAALTKAQILQQAGTAALSQANSAPQSVLSLLG